MTTENLRDYGEGPAENFEKGLYQVEIPELGKPIRGKVRDNWVLYREKENIRISVTTDRQSAFNRIISTTPEKGKVLNLISEFWFNQTNDIIPNHLITIPHPNVLISKQATETVPVEVVVRRFMAKSASPTSIYHNYVNLGRRNIYGIDFPDGIGANEIFPFENPIITPTTKTHDDEELTDSQAKYLVNNRFGNGTWEKIKSVSIMLFKFGEKKSLESGLILADTKYEFGLDKDGNLMLVDEMHSPDSSRVWLKDTYARRVFSKNADPESSDKEILRNHLSQNGYTGQGIIPIVDKDIIEEMTRAYKSTFRAITRHELPQIPPSDQDTIRRAVLNSIYSL